MAIDKVPSSGIDPGGVGLKDIGTTLIQARLTCFMPRCQITQHVATTTTTLDPDLGFLPPLP